MLPAKKVRVLTSKAKSKGLKNPCALPVSISGEDQEVCGTWPSFTDEDGGVTDQTVLKYAKGPEFHLTKIYHSKVFFSKICDQYITYWSSDFDQSMRRTTFFSSKLFFAEVTSHTPTAPSGMGLFCGICTSRSLLKALTCQVPRFFKDMTFKHGDVSQKQDMDRMWYKSCHILCYKF